MPRKLPDTLTSEEVDRLMAQPNVDCPTGLRNRAILEVMYRCGLRRSEVCQVRLRDVRWGDGEVRLTGKGAKDAVVYFDARAREWLERWKAERRRHAAGSPFLFTTLKGGQLGDHYVWEMVTRYARRAGLRHVRPHMLRHTFATDLLRSRSPRFDMAEVRDLMRHSDIRTTAIYLHVHNPDLAEKVRQRA